MIVPFNKPHLTGKELDYIQQAHANLHLAGNGPFTKRCDEWLEQRIGCKRALLTHSCTGALEMASLLAELKAGDEVIMPSFTFVSTANAFVLRGAIPVFVDIRADTLNIDETKVEEAITSKTKALVVMHYAGVGCEMDTLLEIAKRHGLLVIEDAAQSLHSFYREKPLGSMGHLSALSFHETKNIISGEGGALLINDGRFAERAEIIWEKGTNREKFFRGEVDKYTWVDLGSSYLPSELVAAFLWAQMEKADSITAERMDIWNSYHGYFEPFERSKTIRRPIIPPHCRHNAHMYYLLLPDLNLRNNLIDKLRKNGVHAIFHYIPLHDSPAGIKYGRTAGNLPITRSVSECLVRLPLWCGLKPHLPFIFEKIEAILKSTIK